MSAPPILTSEALEAELEQSRAAREKIAPRLTAESLAERTRASVEYRAALDASLAAAEREAMRFLNAHREQHGRIVSELAATDAELERKHEERLARVALETFRPLVRQFASSPREAAVAILAANAGITAQCREALGRDPHDRALLLAFAEAFGIEDAALFDYTERGEHVALAAAVQAFGLKMRGGLHPIEAESTLREIEAACARVCRLAPDVIDAYRRRGAPPGSRVTTVELLRARAALFRTRFATTAAERAAYELDRDYVVPPPAGAFPAPPDRAPAESAP